MKGRQASELGNLQMLVDLSQQILAEQQRTNELLAALNAKSAPTSEEAGAQDAS